MFERSRHPQRVVSSRPFEKNRAEHILQHGYKLSTASLLPNNEDSSPRPTLDSIALGCLSACYDCLKGEI